MSEKTYADFMNEITDLEIYEGLLAYGLFSEKLPPVFTGKSFFDYCQGKTPNFNKPVGFVHYESMRNVNMPRPLGIPNPFAYQQLCRCISDNWSVLEGYKKLRSLICKYWGGSAMMTEPATFFSC